MSMTEYAIAFSGGAVSFLSPCVLPVVPAYLSLTTGLSLSEMSGGDGRSRLVAARGAGLFIVGFSSVFVALGLSVTAVGSALLRVHIPLTRIAGVMVVVMALAMLATTFDRAHVPWRELRFHPRTAGMGLWGAPIVGAAFAFGWTPCIGPVLGSVLAVAASQHALGTGALLLAAYASGLALPFMVTALAFDRSVRALRWTRQHSSTLTRSAAASLGLYGVLLVLDQLAWVTARLQEATTGAGLSWLVTLG
jgi:cytochrome c-type biogenesis protein